MNCSKCRVDFEPRAHQLSSKRNRWCPACCSSYHKLWSSAHPGYKRPGLPPRRGTFIRVCEECGSNYVSRKGPDRFCSKKCLVSWHRKNGKSRYKPKGPGFADLNCLKCGKLFHPKCKQQVFCSRICKVAYSNNKNYLIRRASKKVVSHEFCVTCGKDIQQNQGPGAKKKYCSKICKPKQVQRKRVPIPPPERVCVVCGVVYFSHFAPKHCSAECSRVSRRERVKLKPRNRPAREVRHKIRKFGGKSERVIPGRVFELCGWRCCICGCRTPKNLRGKNKSNSPEIDHIVPLSLGGDHTYSNVQCSCRKCNGAKSAKTHGQPFIDALVRHAIAV